MGGHSHKDQEVEEGSRDGTDLRSLGAGEDSREEGIGSLGGRRSSQLEGDDLDFCHGSYPGSHHGEGCIHGVGRGGRIHPGGAHWDACQESESEHARAGEAPPGSEVV